MLAVQYVSAVLLCVRHVSAFSIQLCWSLGGPKKKNPSPVWLSRVARENDREEAGEDDDGQEAGRQVDDHEEGFRGDSRREEAPAGGELRDHLCLF